MKTKTLIILIVALVLCILAGIIGFMLYGKKQYQPGVKGLSKKSIGIIYCAYNNDGMKEVVDIVAKKLKADVIELKPAVPYPTDEKEFLKRIDNENKDISKVVLSNGVIDLKKYKLVVLGTAVTQKHPCPVIQKFLNDNITRFDKKPVAVMVKFTPNGDASDTLQYFYYKLYNAYKKPSFLSYATDKKLLNRELQIWFDEMEFTHEELR